MRSGSAGWCQTVLENFSKRNVSLLDLINCRKAASFFGLRIFLLENLQTVLMPSFTSLTERR